ncbi:MAG: hypothetical protein JNK49_03080 [Planctomycetes bacterium]|nr:hypothetical protein [Planctomycetota bacterium]
MNATESGWVAGATVGVLALLGTGLRALASRGRYPRLPEADPERPDARGDRLRYHLANGLALALGVVAGGLVFLVPPVAAPDCLWRASLFDLVAARLLAPLFVALSAGGLLAPWLADRWVDPKALVHILRRSSRFHWMGDLDPRPALRWIAGPLLLLALVLHFGLRMEHTTMDQNGIRWRDWPWQSERARPWTEVVDVRIVRTFVATSGDVVERPHLGIEFADGEVLYVGQRDDSGRVDWSRPAELAAARAGRSVRRVDRDE